MRKNAIIGVLICLAALSACSKHDPILPGVRKSIFDTKSVKMADTQIAALPDTAFEMAETECPYTQDSSNVIWDGERKVFSGFPTSNSVKNDAKPVCNGNYLYAGLTTGELIKLNPKTRKIVWIADIYRASNMTGGASVLDIVSPIVIRGANVYAGGLGDAFCKINATTGTKKWCVEIGTAEPFILAGDVVYVVATDNHLYALRDNDGAAYWSTEIDKQTAPKYENGVITVARQKFDGMTGNKQ